MESTSATLSKTTVYSLVNLKNTETDNFVASLIISKIRQAIYRRRKQVMSKRVPYYLYIDECDSVLKFAEEDFSEIMLRARKWKLCLTLANPIPGKLPTGILDMLEMIGNKIIFNLKPKQAALVKDEILPFVPEYLMKLERVQALFRTKNEVHESGDPHFPATTRV